jgi:hypothetical protein
MPSSRYDEKREWLKRRADRISFLIVATDLPQIDLLIEEEKLRRECERIFPESMHLFDMIYSSRFQRLKDQFRPGLEEENPV